MDRYCGNPTAPPSSNDIYYQEDHSIHPENRVSAPPPLGTTYYIQGGRSISHANGVSAPPPFGTTYYNQEGYPIYFDNGANPQPPFGTTYYNQEGYPIYFDNGVNQPPPFGTTSYNQEDHLMYPGNIENFRDRAVCQASNPCTSITDDSSRLSSDPIHQDLEEEKSRASFNILIKKMNHIVYAAAISSYSTCNYHRCALLVKEFALRNKEGLNSNHQKILIHWLRTNNVLPSSDWISLTTEFHSYERSGLFKKHHIESVKVDQEKLLGHFFDQVSKQCNQRPLNSEIDCQGIANVISSLTKVTEKWPEIGKTQKLNDAMIALLFHVKKRACRFKFQETSIMMWGMAKQVVNGLDNKTPGLKEAIISLFSSMKITTESEEERGQCRPQEYSNLMWGISKLVGNVLMMDEILNFKAIMVVLLQNIIATFYLEEWECQFTPQHLTNMLSSFSRLLECGFDVQNFKDAIIILLLQLETRIPSTKDKDRFKSLEIASLLCSVSKLLKDDMEIGCVVYQLEKTAILLLDYVGEYLDQATPQDIINIVWAQAKMLKSSVFLEKIAYLTETAVAPLQKIITQLEKEKYNFLFRELVIFLWAIAKLVEYGIKMDETLNIKEVVDMLLQNLEEKIASKEEIDFISSKGIANIFWAVAFLGELIEITIAKNIFISFITSIGKYDIFSLQELSIILWGLLVCQARLFLSFSDEENAIIEQHINKLFNHLKINSLEDNNAEITLAHTSIWLGVSCPFNIDYKTITSKGQTILYEALKASLSTPVELEKRISSLSPIDIYLPIDKIAIEVNGPFHYISRDFSVKNGATLLKTALLKRLKYEVIEISVNHLDTDKLLKECVVQIQEKIKK